MKAAIAFALATLLLAACAVGPRRPPVADPQQTWQSRQAGLRQLLEWDVRGKVGVRSNEGKSGNANVVWVRRDAAHDIRLFGPFGAGMVRLNQWAGGASLYDPKKKKTYSGDSAREVLYQSTGWKVPFDDLTYWVAGLPAPGATNQLVLDPWGRLASLVQSGWKVSFLDYDRQGGYELPRKLLLESRADGDEASVRVIVKEWGLNL